VRQPFRTRTGSTKGRTTWGALLVAVASVCLVAAGCSSSSKSSSSGATTTTPVASTSNGASSGTSSTPGVTATTITVGQIADLSAPVQGLFEGAKVGTQAYFNYINSQGGVDGRKLLLDSKDSQFNAGTIVAQGTAIAQHDLAMVGSYSLLDAALKPVLDRYNVPYIGVPISQTILQDPNVYATWVPPLDQIPTGAMQYFAQKYPTAVKHVGTIYGSVAAALFPPIKAAAQSVGWNFDYTRAYGATETNFLPDAIKMKAAGVQLVYDFGSGSAEQTSQWLKAAQEANFHPIEVQSENYFNTLAQLAGSTANGVYFPLTYALFAGEDAQAVPEVALLDQWAKQTDPSYTADSGDLVWGWSSAMLFVQALKDAGANPTRAGLSAALQTITSFGANGLLPPSNIATNQASGCWLLAEMVNGKYQRTQPTPATGFICQPGGLYQVPGTPTQTTRSSGSSGS
jgi:ABC-type branched-subunit amino acid transport system substrate-binding protein